MRTLKIAWLEEESEYETCGTVFASGAIACLDGEEIVRLIPQADCNGGITYTEYEIFKEILEKLGYILAENNE